MFVIMCYNCPTMAAGDIPPYIVSSDVYGLMRHWAQNSGAELPSEAFFDDNKAALAHDLKMATDAQVEVVDQQELEEGMRKLVDDSDGPVISLDRAYLKTGHEKIIGHVDATRAVNEYHADIGLMPRPGADSLEKQLKAAAALHDGHVNLIDDVIFSGDGTLALAERLIAHGQPVRRVYAGIGIAGGIKKIEEAGIEVICVKTYDDVMDEVCERDFYPGVPMSGRTVLSGDGQHWSAPYLLPMGSVEWASIQHDRAIAFSASRLICALEMWHGIEEASGRKILASEVPRQLKVPQTLETYAGKVLSITEVLQSYLNELGD